MAQFSLELIFFPGCHTFRRIYQYRNVLLMFVILNLKIVEASISLYKYKLFKFSNVHIKSDVYIYIESPVR